MDQSLETQIADLYLNNKLSGIKVAQKLGIDHHYVYDTLRRLHIPRRHNRENSRKYNVNMNFFDIIDTEEKAYWLGFIYADGYVTRNAIGIAIHVKDRVHLQKYLTCLNADYPIHQYTTDSAYSNNTTYVRVVITGDHIYKTIIKQGVLPHKSLILKFPTEEQVPSHLINHFIRGYFDGDGSLNVTKKTNTSSISFQGTKEFLEELAKILKPHGTGIDNKKPPAFSLGKRHKDDKNTYYIGAGGNNMVLQLCDFIYKDATIYLDRKYELYVKRKELYNSRLKK